MGAKKKVVLAYSGGLDTSYCIPYLREEEGYDVITVTVDTGGFSRDELEKIEARASSLGVLSHRTVDGRERVFEAERRLEGQAIETEGLGIVLALVRRQLRARSRCKPGHVLARSQAAALR